MISFFILSMCVATLAIAFLLPAAVFLILVALPAMAFWTLIFGAIHIAFVAVMVLMFIISLLLLAISTLIIFIFSRRKTVTI